VLAVMGEAAASPRTRADWKERLETWRQTTAGLAEAAARLVVGALEERSRVLTEGIDSILRPGAFWRFDTSRAAVPVRGLPSPESARSNRAVAEDSSGSRMWVQVEETGSNERAVAVRIDRFSFTQKPPLVVLVPCGNVPDRKARIAELIPDGEGLAARFDNVEPGEHLLLVEPAPISSEG